MRVVVTGLTCALLLLTPSLASAQDTLRVTLDVSESLDGSAARMNTFQYYAFRQLHTFGLRVDSLAEVNNSRCDDWIASRTARWAEQDGDTSPPATLSLRGQATAEYDNAEFYGQSQAHNFKGSARVTLADADGSVLAEFVFNHEWGRLPARYTKSQTQQEFNDVLFTTVLIGILTHESVAAGIPEDKQEDLATWIVEQRDRVLRALEGNNMEESEIAEYLRGLELDQD
jgi:dsDNA-binding SOS-regulon protein